VKQDVLESAQYCAEIRGGHYQVPDRALYGKVLDALSAKQSRTTDSGERRRLIREFEKRYDETHYIPTLQYHRIIPHSAKVRGWTITPSHCINQQLDTAWLAR